MMVTFSDPCDFNQLKLGLCQLTKSLNKNACLLLLFSPSVNSHLFVTPCISAHQAFLSFIISLSLIKLKSIKSMMPSSHLILCHPLLLLFSSIRVFSSESVLHIRWPKYQSSNFGISLFNEYSGLISFRIEKFGISAVQETLKSLLQHHSSKASILWCSTLFNSHIYT